MPNNANNIYKLRMQDDEHADEALYEQRETV